MSDPVNFCSPGSPNIYFGFFDENSSQSFGFLPPGTSEFEGGQSSSAFDEGRVSEEGFDVSGFWADLTPSAPPPPELSTEPSTVSLEGPPLTDVSQTRSSLSARDSVVNFHWSESNVDQLQAPQMGYASWSVEEKVFLVALLKLNNCIDIVRGTVIKLSNRISWMSIKPQMHPYTIFQRKNKELYRLFDGRINGKALKCACAAVRNKGANNFKTDVFKNFAPQALKDEYENIYKALKSW